MIYVKSKSIILAFKNSFSVFHSVAFAR